MEDVRFAGLEGQDAGIGQIFGIDELVAIAAVANDPNGFAILNKFEQDGEQAEAAAIDDGGAAQDDNVKITGVASEDFFGGELGLAVDFSWCWRFAFTNRVAGVAGPEAIGRGEDKFRNAVVAACFGEHAGGANVGGPEVALVERHAVRKDRSAVKGSIVTVTVEDV